MIRLPIVHISLRDFETVEANIPTNRARQIAESIQSEEGNRGFL